MKLKTMFAVGTFAFTTWRAWSGLKRDVRKNARRALIRAGKAI